jgi:hypothetical protein
MDDDLTIRLTGWTGPWADDDPDANFKAEVARYATVDPLVTVRGLSRAVDVPVGALCHYVLARWATEGSAGLLELGPTTVRRLGVVCDEAEADGTDEARLAAYHRLRGLVSWLQYPLDHPEVHDGGDAAPPDQG